MRTFVHLFICIYTDISVYCSIICKRFYFKFRAKQIKILPAFTCDAFKNFLAKLVTTAVYNAVSTRSSNCLQLIIKYCTKDTAPGTIFEFENVFQYISDLMELKMLSEGLWKRCQVMPSYSFLNFW